MTLARELVQRVVARRAPNLPNAALDWRKLDVMEANGVRRC